MFEFKPKMPGKRQRPPTREKGLLYAALNCIYLQGNDDIRISLGQPYLHYKREYREVLTREEMRGVVVLGYMAQGRVQAQHDDEHVSACVHSNWIRAHMLLTPTGGRYSADFAEAVKLAERASETLSLVSMRIGQAALALAEKLGVDSGEIFFDEQLVPENPLQVSIPRLPAEFARCWPPMTKTEGRVAFVSDIMDIFSFFLCIAEHNWTNIDEIMLSATGMRKRYSEMTPEERRGAWTHFDRPRKRRARGRHHGLPRCRARAGACGAPAADCVRQEPNDDVII